MWPAASCMQACPDLPRPPCACCRRAAHRTACSAPPSTGQLRWGTPRQCLPSWTLALMARPWMWWAGGWRGPGSSLIQTTVGSVPQASCFAEGSRSGKQHTPAGGKPCGRSGAALLQVSCRDSWSPVHCSVSIAGTGGCCCAAALRDQQAAALQQACASDVVLLVWHVAAAAGMQAGAPRGAVAVGHKAHGRSRAAVFRCCCTIAHAASACSRPQLLQRLLSTPWWVTHLNSELALETPLCAQAFTPATAHSHSMCGSPPPTPTRPTHTNTHVGRRCT